MKVLPLILMLLYLYGCEQGPSRMAKGADSLPGGRYVNKPGLQPDGEKANTMLVTIMVPKDLEGYKKAMTGYINDGGTDPSVMWPFIAEQVRVPYSDDVLKASANAAAAKIRPGGGPPVASVDYLKVKDRTAYVLLNIDVDGWAGVSYSTSKIHPLVRQTLLKFPQVEKVITGKAPEDSNFR